MSSKSPRVNVVVTEEQHALLMEMGRLQRRSAASFLRELLDTATPIMRVALPILRARDLAIEEQPEALDKAAREALGALIGDAGDQMDLLDGLASLLGSVDVVGRSGTRSDPCERPQRASERVPGRSRTGSRPVGGKS